MPAPPSPALPSPTLTAGSSKPAPPRQTVPAAPAVLRTTSDALFAGADEVQIHHAGAVYRLKRTSLGKLILTK